MEHVLEKLPIKSIILLSRVSQFYNLLTVSLLNKIPDRNYVREFLKVKSTVWKAILHPKLTVDYLINHPNIIKLTEYDQYFVLNFDRVYICLYKYHFYYFGSTRSPYLNIGYKSNIDLKVLLNIDFNPIKILDQMRIKSYFNINNSYLISCQLVHDYLLDYFPADTIISVQAIAECDSKIGNDIVKYADDHALEVKIRVKADADYFHLTINKHKISCSIRCKNDQLTRINYEYIMNIIKSSLYHNNMVNAAMTNNIKLLKQYLKHERSLSFIKCYLGQYLLISKNDLFFDQFITDNRIKLYRYRNNQYIKPKLLYRFWLIKELGAGKIDHDNIIDVTHYYKLIL